MRDPSNWRQFKWKIIYLNVFCENNVILLSKFLRPYMCYCRLWQTKQSWKNFNMTRNKGSQQFSLLKWLKQRYRRVNFFPVKSLALATVLTVGGDGNGRQCIGGCLHQASAREWQRPARVAVSEPLCRGV